LAENPTSAFILSLLAGIFFVIGAGLLIGIGALVGSIGDLGSLGSIPGLGNATSISGSTSGVGLSIVGLGVFGVLLGIVTIAAAVLIHERPAKHRLWGALLVVFSVVSWVGSIGGLLIGFILGLIGGVLAITWKPSVASTQFQITRVCPNCGTVIQKDVKFCPHCGRSLP